MKLSHFAHEPIEALRPIEQTCEDRGFLAQFKPKGLWVSVDGTDDWPSWCESEEFEGLGTYHYRVDLHLDHRLLVLDNALDLRDFTREYNHDFTIKKEGLPPYTPWYGNYIRWGDVAKKYPGIIIAPYQWPCRMGDDTFWYYPWDCASGCIRDPSIIRAYDLIGRREPIVRKPRETAGAQGPAVL